MMPLMNFDWQLRLRGRVRGRRGAGHGRQDRIRRDRGVHDVHSSVHADRFPSSRRRSRTCSAALPLSERVFGFLEEPELADESGKNAAGCRCGWQAAAGAWRCGIQPRAVRLRPGQDDRPRLLCVGVGRPDRRWPSSAPPAPAGPPSSTCMMRFYEIAGGTHHARRRRHQVGSALDPRRPPFAHGHGAAGHLAVPPAPSATTSPTARPGATDDADPRRGAPAKPYGLHRYVHVAARTATTLLLDDEGGAVSARSRSSCSPSPAPCLARTRPMLILDEATTFGRHPHRGARRSRPWTR